MRTKEGTAVIGMQWGDEAKGKIVDIESANHDVVVRYQGGNNAGHTANGVDLHAIPSGSIRNITSYIASGCAVNLPAIDAEADNIEQKKPGVDVRGNLHISPQASLVQPHQILDDGIESAGIGTTHKGIGPHYADKARRMVDGRRVDLRVGELLDHPDDVFRMMRRNLKVGTEKVMANPDLSDKQKRVILQSFGLNKTIDAYRAATERLIACIDHDPYWLRTQYENGKRILLEGAQAEGLDLVRGTTPFVTSSRTGLYGGLDSTSLPREAIGRVIGVGKLITSRVGYGPFVSEFGGRKSELYCMKDDGKAHTKEIEEAAFGHLIEKMLQSGNALQIGQALRLLTGEYGVTSKRPRRIGAFDVVQFALAAKINEVTEVVLSKLDCLNIFSRTKEGMIPLVVGYMLNGQKIDFIPVDEKTLRKVQPIVEWFPSFTENISRIRASADLPAAARNLIHDEIEPRINGGKVTIAGVGPGPKENVHFGKRAA